MKGDERTLTASPANNSPETRSDPKTFHCMCKCFNHYITGPPVLSQHHLSIELMVVFLFKYSGFLICICACERVCLPVCLCVSDVTRLVFVRVCIWKALLVRLQRVPLYKQIVSLCFI